MYTYRVMKTSFAHIFTFSLLALVGIAGFFAMYNHIAHLQQGLSDATQKVGELEGKVAHLALSRCPTEYTWQPASTYSFTIESGGLVRSYHVRTPADYTANLRAPLVIAYDGLDGSGRHIESYAGLDTLPALIAYPDSVIGKRKLTAWQGAPYSADGVNDVQFTRDMLDTLRNAFCVDADNTFAVGMSNGGGFAWLAACHIADIKAIATVSAAHYSNCRANRPVSILAFHSLADKNVPFAGSKHSGLQPAYGWMQEKAQENGCDKTPLSERAKEYIKTTWRSCKNDATTELIRVPHQRHGWLAAPSTAADTYLRPKNTAQYIWQFFTTR